MSVSYRRDESIAVVTMDDGKVNALGPDMLAEINESALEMPKGKLIAAIRAIEEQHGWTDDTVKTFRMKHAAHIDLGKLIKTELAAYYCVLSVLEA